ncbi:hypothetical protein [uncultured Brachyspira sp.]|uniref:hypothetical protein n=1 Tax=uncultured Brachyspira sp. TaxID=221953 RepID=UPI00260B8402|nr:hypothetical protein [uncultured Brachyspira sp.]
MNKKLFSILFILFLAGILFVSCSNNDKTGSGSNAKIDPKYKGSWYNEGGELMFIIADDGSVLFGGSEPEELSGSGNTYTLKVTVKNQPYNLKITFITDSSAELSNLDSPSEPPETLTKK